MSERKATIGQLIDRLSVFRQKIDKTIEGLSVNNYEPSTPAVDDMAEEFIRRSYDIELLFNEVEELLPEPEE